MGRALCIHGTLIVVVFWAVGVGAAELTPEEANVAVVQAIGEAMNAQDLDALDGLMAPDLVRHSAATPGVEVRSLEEFKQFLRQDSASFSDTHQDLQMIVADDDLAAAYVVYRGIQSGPMGPFPATGSPFELPFMAFFRLEEGKVQEMWVEWDNMALLRQLGHLPPGPPPAADAAEPEASAAAVRAFAEAWNSHDVERVAALVTPDVRYTVVGGTVLEGAEAVAGYAESTFAGSSDVFFRTRAIHVDGQHAVWEWVMEGTHDGDWTDLPATGRSYAIHGASVVEIEDGLVRRGCDYWDRAALLDQLSGTDE